MPSRRALLLGTVAVAGSFAAAGCLGGTPAADDADTAASGGGANAAAETGSAPTDDADATPAPTDAPARPARGANVTVSRTVTDPDLRYDESRDAVRVVAAYRHTNHAAVANGSEPPAREPVYEWVPFDRWAETECASVAARAVRDAIAKRLGSVTGLSVGVGSAGDGGDLAVSASLTTAYGRDGDVVTEPDATVAEVAAAAPASVAATVRIDGREHACTHRPTVESTRVYYQ